MSDPLSPPIMAKVLAGIGGLVGGVVFMVFLRPKNVWDAAIRSSVSTAIAIIGSIPLIDYLGMHVTNDNIFSVAVAIGFCAWSLLSFVVKVLLKIQDEKTTIRIPWFEKSRRK